MGRGATFCAAFLAIFLSLVPLTRADDFPQWGKLPAIPDAEGFAAGFAGVSEGALIFAGGANITGEKWGETFTKKWYDGVYALSRLDDEWQKVGTLPAPRAYGVSITANDAVICIGGSNEATHTDDVLELRLRAGKLAITRKLPRLPRPIANACGALVCKTIYIAGGLESPAATKALATVYALDLSRKKPAWRELPAWPGAERMFAVAGAAGDAFYLFSGVSLAPGADGKPVRTYLRDAYRYTPGSGWSKLPDLPRPAAAAPSPAFLLGDKSELAIVSGDDGANVDFKPLHQHPGFPRDILSFDFREKNWTVHSGGTPLSRATAPVVSWRRMVVIPNGEVRPRERTNEVWGYEP